jgi:flagella basal body P-ring formation protein FlgA
MMRTLAVVVVAAVLASLGCLPTVASAQPFDQGSGAPQRILGKRFEALAKPQIANVHPDGDAVLQLAYPIPDQMVPSGNVSLVVGSALVNPVFVNVPIEIDVDGHFVRQIFVGYKIQQYVHTAVAAVDLVPGTVLGYADVKMARVPFNGQRTNGIEALIGRRILSPIRAGQQIAIEVTQTNQIVKAGATIVMIIHDGGVDVVADVVARESGGLGDQIAVFNPQTNKALSGTIIGPDRVELDLSGGTQ